MGFTTDANTTEFDENNKENQVAVHQIAEKLASFRSDSHYRRSPTRVQRIDSIGV